MILITGGSGVLGSELRRLLPDALAPTHSELDVSDAPNVGRFFQRTGVETVIHCAAQTSVRGCEVNREQAFSVNVEGTKNISEALAAHREDGYLLYVSTACVFPGDNMEKYYSEEDTPYPKNFYGLTKLLGECRVQEVATRSGIDALIIRTNFVARGKWKYPSAFTDRFGTYLYADQVAKALIDLLHARREGLVHVCGDKRMSMYDLARITDPNVKPMTLEGYNGPPVTVNMCLRSNRLAPIHFAHGT